MSKKFKLTSNTKVVFGITLYQIQALIDIPNFGIKAGDLGGYVEKESSLSQENNAWVFGNARVFGDARVSGNALVFGNALVSGDAQVFGNALIQIGKIIGKVDRKYKKVLFIQGSKDLISINDDVVHIGCKTLTSSEWLDQYKNIGSQENYSQEQIKEYGILLTCANEFLK